MVTGAVAVTDAVVTPVADPALTDPALSALVCEPLGCAPDVLIQTCLSMEGRCQYCGATSITT